MAAQAHVDATAAYTTLANEAPTADLSGQNLGGLTLTPGVYNFTNNAALTGTLTLDATGNPNGTFIFQIASTLTTASNSVVTLLGTSSDSNIFWQIGSSATLGTNSVLEGNILALTSISMEEGATIPNGRALASNGHVLLDTNTVAFTIVTENFWNGGVNELWSSANWSPDVSGATSSTLSPGATSFFQSLACNRKMKIPFSTSMQASRV